MTPAEQAQLDADRAASAAATATAETQHANELALRQGLRDRLQEMADLANLIESGAATAADQRRALVLSLRGSLRLARLVNSQLDQAV